MDRASRGIPACDPSRGVCCAARRDRSRGRGRRGAPAPQVRLFPPGRRVRNPVPGGVTRGSDAGGIRDSRAEEWPAASSLGVPGALPRPGTRLRPRGQTPRPGWRSLRPHPGPVPTRPACGAGGGDTARSRLAVRFVGPAGRRRRNRAAPRLVRGAAWHQGEPAMIGILIAGVVGLAIGVVVFVLIDRTRRGRAASEQAAANETAARMVEEARKEADALRKEAELRAKDLVLQAKSEAERDAREQRRDLVGMEKRVAQKEEAADRKSEALASREADLASREETFRERDRSIEAKRAEVTALVDAVRKKLEETAGMTRDEAKRSLVEQMTEEARGEAAKQIRQIESEAREEADRRAKKIVSIAIERLAGEFVADRTVSVVALPGAGMKGRIIGREGRNSRAIEAATGVDLIIDDTPEAVVISCHNPIRRELARLALDRLISDGRIHPGRIEEVVRKAEQELEESIREAGQKAVIELGLHGVHQELGRLVGMLKYRYSYAQNVLGHSIETAFIAGALAAELGLNVKQARRAGLLHDIGKALTHEVEGSHAIVGGEIARKYGESAKIVNAIAAHHEEVKAETILAPLVDAADALSGARPGARREVLESYAKRLEDLERISNSFKGVERSYAVQAGREIRVIVDPGTVPDDQAALLAREVARRIEQEMTYPGQIKVTVIRETRASEIAH